MYINLRGQIGSKRGKWKGGSKKIASPFDLPLNHYEKWKLFWYNFMTKF